MNKRKDGEFDCVEMKRQLSERFYEATKAFSAEELLRHIEEKVEHSRLTAVPPQLHGERYAE